MGHQYTFAALRYRGALWFKYLRYLTARSSPAKQQSCLIERVVPLLHFSLSDLLGSLRVCSLFDTHLFYYRDDGWLGMCVELGYFVTQLESGAFRSDTYIIQPLTYINEN